MRTTLRRFLFVLALAAGLVALGPAAADGPKDEAGFQPLFGKDLKGFKTLPEKARKTFQVKDEAIYVSGNPAGYFYTDKSYKNYVLRFEWKFLKDGNSGTLVHITGDHKVWPKCVEVQGMQKQHGHIFAIGGAKGSFKTDKANLQKAIKVGEWNTTEIVSRDGMVSSKVNGIEISTGTSELTEGPIGFQSEGAPMLYKNLRIKVLD